MSITQTIPSLGTVPSTNDPANFDANADALLGTGLPAFRDALNIFSGQANALGSQATTDAGTASTAAANSQTSADDSAASAASASGAGASATAAAASATEASNKFDEFDAIYLGEKSSEPTLDNQGNALQEGATYFNTVTSASKVYNGAAWQIIAPTVTSVTLSQVTDFPTQSGQTGKYLSTNGTAPTWEVLTTDPTLGTLTKTFTTGEASTITLSSAVTAGAPVVSVSKEVAQTGVSNGNWDVDSTTENYTRLDSAPATTLDWVVGDVSTAVYTQAFSVAAQETAPQGLAFNTDGTKMFVTGNSGDDVNEYALSTGFDVSTAVFTDAFSVAAQDLNPYGLAFNTTGTKMFISGSTGDAVYEYALSTGFDVSTASFTDSFSVAAQDIKPQDIAFNTDGTKMFIVGDTSNSVYEYALTTGFDVSTASFTDAFSVAGQDLTPEGLAFNADGTSMFVVARANGAVYEYTLATGFDVSTASFNTSFSVTSQEVSPAALAFNTTGTKMFVAGYSGDDVNEYTISAPLTLGTGSFASTDVGKTIEANSGAFVLTATSGSHVETTAPTSYAQVASGSWGMFSVVYNATDGDLELSSVFNPSTVFDVSTTVYTGQAFSVAGQDTSPNGMAFSTDGTKMFVVGAGSQAVNEYALTTGFDLSTASFTDAFSVAGQDTGPRGMAFSTDGTKMFVYGDAGKDVNEYTLSTGFDVSTATFIGNFVVSGQDTNMFGLTFNAAGTKMFMVGYTNHSVYEYALSTGYTISTTSFVRSLSISAQETGVRDIAFNTDGTKMFIIGTAGDDVNEYTLSTGFNISTASFVDSFSARAEDTQPHAIVFNPEGTKLFMLGTAGDGVSEYNVGSFATPTGYNPVHTTSSIDSTYWTDINSMTAAQAVGDGTINYCISTDDRTTWGIVDNTSGERDIVRNNGGTWQYNSNATYASETWANGATNTELATIAEAMESAAVVTGYQIASATLSHSFDLASQITQPQGMAFNNDGTKMYFCGGVPKSIFQYALSTAYDISTASYSSITFNLTAYDDIPSGVAFNADGTKMFISGQIGKDINEFTLSTAFNVSTASFVDSFSVLAQETSPQDLAFNTAGTTMIVLGATGDDVNEYTLSTGFDVSTASFVDSFSVSSQDTEPKGLTFSPDGTTMVIAGNATDALYRYTLTTGFDVSTSSFVDSFDVSGQEATPAALSFNADGTQMYVTGYSSDSVFQYASGTTAYTNKMDKTQLDAVTDANHIVLGNNLDLAIVFNLSSGTTVPSSDGVAINYDANVLNQLAIAGTDYDADFPATDKVRITALSGANLKVRVV